MGNRMIKETIRTSRSVNSMTDFQFRVWVYLITYVDDYGRGSADPELLKGLVFPRRKRLAESDIKKALADFYADGRVYFVFGHLQVELYSEYKDPSLESKVEAALSGFAWTKDEEFLNEEKCYLVTYELEVKSNE